MSDEVAEDETDAAQDGESLHQQYEPEKPIHRAVNITYWHLQDRIEPVEHDEYDLWKARDPETGRTSRSWWRSPEQAVEMLAKAVDNELCFVNECTNHIGPEAIDDGILYCEEHSPDEYVECAEDGCDYPTSHTATDFCSAHTWRNGRSAEKGRPVTDGGQPAESSEETAHAHPGVKPSAFEYVGRKGDRL